MLLVACEARPWPRGSSLTGWQENMGVGRSVRDAVIVQVCPIAESMPEKSHEDTHYA